MPNQIIQKTLSGSQEVAVGAGSTTFYIKGYRPGFQPLTSSTTVEVGNPLGLVDLPLTRKSCAGNTATYEGTFKSGVPGTPAFIAKNDLITSVENLNGRKVLISHGFSVPVAAHSSTSAFNGSPPQGTWTLSTDLIGEEQCLTGGVAPAPGTVPAPASMTLRIRYGCK